MSERGVMDIMTDFTYRHYFIRGEFGAVSFSFRAGVTKDRQLLELLGHRAFPHQDANEHQFERQNCIIFYNRHCFPILYPHFWDEELFKALNEEGADALYAKLQEIYDRDIGDDFREVGLGI